MNISNHVTLIGNLGGDFELKEFASGRMMAKSRLATNETYKNKDGEYVQETQWHNLVVWGKKAQVLAQKTQKGSSLALSGKITYNQYEDNDGIRKSITEIIVDDFRLLDQKNG